MTQAGVTFTGDDAERIARVVRWAESLMSQPSQAPTWGAQLQETFAARCTSSTPDSSGHYSAMITRWDEDTSAWVDAEMGEIRVKVPNDETLVGGFRYPVRGTGETSASLPLYLLLSAASTGETPCTITVVTNVCTSATTTGVIPASGGTGAGWAGPASPGTAAGPDWVDPTNALATDGSFATFVIDVSDGATELFELGGFPLLISGPTITGILVEVLFSCDPVDSVAFLYTILKLGETYVGELKSIADPASGGYLQFGDELDLWEYTWTPLTASLLTVAIQAKSLLDAVTVQIDHVQVTVYFSGGAVIGGSGGGTTTLTQRVEYSEINLRTCQILRTWCVNNPQDCCDTGSVPLISGGSIFSGGSFPSGPPRGSGTSTLFCGGGGTVTVPRYVFFQMDPLPIWDLTNMCELDPDRCLVCESYWTANAPLQLEFSQAIFWGGVPGWYATLNLILSESPLYHCQLQCKLEVVCDPTTSSGYRVRCAASSGTWSTGGGSGLWGFNTCDLSAGTFITLISETITYSPLNAVWVLEYQPFPGSVPYRWTVTATE